MNKGKKLIPAITALLIIGAILSYQSPNPGLYAPYENKVAQAATHIPAFPGAEGWGAQSVGGRGGQVFEVITLEDNVAGSLRHCAEVLSGPRTCVFRVAGIINLTKTIRITNPYITIAGQTAPGDGITIKSAANDRIFLISTHNVIIRYLHFRGGAKSFVTIRSWNDAHDIIVDHCSASGGEDDIIDIHYNDETLSDPDIRNITIQNCLLAEAHAVHPSGLLASGYSDLTADPPIIGSSLIHHISVHRNFFVHNGWRNPLIKSGYTEVVNNVVYNWSNRIGGTGDHSEADWINNYWKAGPMSESTPLVFEWFDDEQREYPFSSIYIAGNILPSYGAFTPTQKGTTGFCLEQTKVDLEMNTWGEVYLKITGVLLH